VIRIDELGTTFVFLCRVRRLVVTDNLVPSSPILVALMMDAPHFSETSVLTRATRRNIPEDGIPHGHHSENLKSYHSLNSCHRRFYYLLNRVLK
jgi:hypothetical protein